MKILVTAYPFATQYGTIDVPDDVEDVREYIDENFDEIKFGEPDLDYCGTDWDYERED